MGVRQDREGPAAACFARDQDRAGLGHEALAGSEPRVAGLESVFVEGRAGDVDAMRAARNSRENTLDERMGMPGDPLPVPLTGLRKQAVSRSG